MQISSGFKQTGKVLGAVRTKDGFKFKIQSSTNTSVDLEFFNISESDWRLITGLAMAFVLGEEINIDSKQTVTFRDDTQCDYENPRSAKPVDTSVSDGKTHGYDGWSNKLSEGREHLPDDERTIGFEELEAASPLGAVEKFVENFQKEFPEALHKLAAETGVAKFDVTCVDETGAYRDYECTYRPDVSSGSWAIVIGGIDIALVRGPYVPGSEPSTSA